MRHVNHAKLYVVIRSARNSDMPSLRKLVRYLMYNEEISDVAKQTKIIIQRRIIPALSRRSPSNVFVAQHQGKIIGFILIETLHSLVASLVYLAVDPHYQKQGVGRNLIEQAARFAKKRNIKILQTMIHKDNKYSRAFHKRIGFRLFGYVLRKQI